MSISLVVHVNGDIDDVELPEEEAGNLQLMYTVLECATVDVVCLADNIDMWLDDDGIGAGRKINPLATRLARGYGLVYQPYFGTALLCSADANGSSTNLSDEQASSLLSQLEILRHW